jgi:hypothetical protein
MKQIEPTLRISRVLKKRARLLASMVLLSLPAIARASFLSGDALDTFATGMAWFVICVVPIVVIVLFWFIHVMPEKVAEKRHHPQKDAIKTLCMLSLLFGGLLWPIAWLWAYAKPTNYRMAYGTDKHDDYFVEMGEKARAGELVDDEIAHLAHELEAMAKKGLLPPKFKALHADLAALGAESGSTPAKTGAA